MGFARGNAYGRHTKHTPQRVRDLWRVLSMRTGSEPSKADIDMLARMAVVKPRKLRKAMRRKEPVAGVYIFS